MSTSLVALLIKDAECSAGTNDRFRLLRGFLSRYDEMIGASDIKAPAGTGAAGRHLVPDPVKLGRFVIASVIEQSAVTGAEHCLLASRRNRVSRQGWDVLQK